MNADAAAVRRARLAAGAFVLLGIALRWAAAYPAHKYAADADCLNSGFIALRILDGHTPAWYTPRRIGSLECYVHAVAFRFLGPTREALAVAPLLSGSVALVLWAALVLPLLGPLAGPVAVLLFALPPPSYLFWTYMPNAYPETLLLCVAALWAAHGARRRPEEAWRLALFGFVAGLGFWNSIQTLASTLPAALWIAAGRPRSLARAAALAFLGFVLGALPWVAWNVAVPLGSFAQNFAVRPAGGPRALLDNGAYLVRYAIPELVASWDPQNRPGPAPPVPETLRPLVLVLWAGAGSFVAVRVAAAAARRRRGARELFPPESILVFVGAAACLFATISGAGGMRGLTVRYVLPLFLTLAAAGGVLAGHALARGGLARAAAIAALAAVLAFNASGWALPGSPDRRLWEKRRDADSDLVAFLEERRVQAVAGDYWSAYPVNFLSLRRVAGVPFQPEVDFYGVEPSLGARPLSWALVGTSRAELEPLAARTGTSGLLVEVSRERWVFIPEIPPEGAPAFLSRYRAAFFHGR